MNIQQITATSFIPLLSPVINAEILTIAYLNWKGLLDCGSVNPASGEIRL